MKINYYPEVDGLRAIAVFGVIFYHLDITLLNKNILSGGFIGVDIFFVISGYLISLIILQEIKTTGNFSFKNFYEKRIRRIVPAYLISVLFTLPFVFILLLDGGLRDFARSLISTIFFLSNIYFWGTDNVYGAEYSLSQPLLHTWSLSVEVQFYILFPVLIFFLINNYSKSYFKIIFFFFILSLSFATWSAFTQKYFIYNIYKSFSFYFFSSANFYLLPTRAFEFLFGTIILYFQLNSFYFKKKIQENYFLKNILSVLGFFLIIFSFLFFNDRMLMPSLYSIFPLLGVFLIIIFSDEQNIINKILSNKTLVFFGIISYSLYLFHFPIFAFSRIANIFDQSIYIKILLLILTIFLSILNFYLIEKPFRNKKLISFKILIISLITIYIFLIICSLNILKNDGYKKRLPNIISQLNFRDKIELNQNSNLKKIILVGDSHADSLFISLNEFLINNFNLIRFKSRFLLNNFNYIKKDNNSVDESFPKLNNNIFNFLEEHKNLIVILHYRWTLNLIEENFDNKEGFRDYQKEHDKFTSHYYEPFGITTNSQSAREEYIKLNLINNINRITNLGHKVILVYPVPELGFNPVRLIFNDYLYNKFFSKNYHETKLLSVSYEVYKNRNNKIFQILDSIKNENIYRVYPHNFLCDLDVNRCFANSKNEIFYYDNNHLSFQGSRYIVKDIIKIINKLN